MYNEISQLLTFSFQAGMGMFHQCCIARLVIFIKGKTTPFPKDYHHNLYRMFRIFIHIKTVCAVSEQAIPILFWFYL